MMLFCKHSTFLTPESSKSRAARGGGRCILILRPASRSLLETGGSGLILFYFSGTGNSRYIARAFCERYPAQCRSIEEHADFDALIAAGGDTVGFCYPVYGSSVPRLMREFVQAHAEALSGKRFVIFCTQLIFSGDGAHALTAFLPQGESNVIYAEHFRMPNNLCNVPVFPVTNGPKNDRLLRLAQAKVRRAAAEISRGIVRRRGFSRASVWLGRSQSVFWPGVESAAAKDVRIDESCVRCGLCARICPTGNLSLGENGVEQAGRCMVCYRCVNACPKGAITVLIHAKPRRRYLGVSGNFIRDAEEDAGRTEI